MRFMGNQGSMDDEDGSDFADAQAGSINSLAAHVTESSLCWFYRAPTQLCS